MIELQGINSSTTNHCTRPPTFRSFLTSLRQRVSLSLCCCACLSLREGSTPVADIGFRSMRVLASALLRLQRAGSGAAFWVSVRAAFLLFGGFWLLRGAALSLWCSFWVSAADMFLLVSKYFGRAASGGANVPTAAQQGAASDRLQLRSSFLLSALPAAGELVVSPSRAALWFAILLGMKILTFVLLTFLFLSSLMFVRGDEP